MTWYHIDMKTMIISEFKAKCIGVLKDAQRDHETVIVTWRGQPLARIEPITDQRPPRRLGGLKGKMAIIGDIVNTNWSADWEMNR